MLALTYIDGWSEKLRNQCLKISTYVGIFFSLIPEREKYFHFSSAIDLDRFWFLRKCKNLQFLFKKFLLLLDFIDLMAYLKWCATSESLRSLKNSGKSRFSAKVKAWQSLLKRFTLLLTRLLKHTKKNVSKINQK